MLGDATVRRYLAHVEATGSVCARPHGGGRLASQWRLRTRAGLHQGTTPTLAAISPRDAAGGLAHDGNTIGQPFEAAQ